MLTTLNLLIAKHEPQLLAVTENGKDYHMINLCDPVAVKNLQYRCARRYSYGEETGALVVQLESIYSYDSINFDILMFIDDDYGDLKFTVLTAQGKKIMVSRDCNHYYFTMSNGSFIIAPLDGSEEILEKIDIWHGSLEVIAANDDYTEIAISDEYFHMLENAFSVKA